MKTRKQLKDEYKLRKTEMGVFQVRQRMSNRILLDSSTDMYAKWNRHQAQLSMDCHRNVALQEAWNKHGKESFSFEILSKLDYSEDNNVDYSKELKLLEEMVIEELKNKQLEIF